MWADLRHLADQRAIDVGYLEPVRHCQANRVAQENVGRRAFPLRIGGREVLADIADTAEMDASMVTRLLDTDSDIDDIRARDANAREKGVSGVPTFIVANQHALSGAQPPELWTQVIADIAAQMAEAAPKTAPQA